MITFIRDLGREKELKNQKTITLYKKKYNEKEDYFECISEEIDLKDLLNTVYFRTFGDLNDTYYIKPRIVVEDPFGRKYFKCTVINYSTNENKNKDIFNQMFIGYIELTSFLEDEFLIKGGKNFNKRIKKDILNLINSV